MMPHFGRGVSLTLFLLAFVLSFPDHGLRPAPNASHAQGIIRNLIARLRGETMPAGIVKANGLVEVAQVDVSSRYPGRLAEISVKEGAKVAIGQAIGRVSSPEADVTLVSPRSGEVEDLLAETGKAVAAGESIVTIVDLTDVYMTVFLPAAETAKLGMGDEARVILDAAPDYVIPAAVSFIASATQISPKSIETKNERDKQTFRVDLRVDPQVLKTYYGRVEGGLRGAGFVRTKPAVKWPAELQIKLPSAPVAQEPAPAPAPLAQDQKLAPVPSPVTEEPASPAPAPPPVAEATSPSPAAQGPTPAPAPTPAPVAQSPKPEPAPSPQAQEPRPTPPTAAVAGAAKRSPAASPQAKAPAPAPIAEASTTPGPAEQGPVAEFAPGSITQLVGAWAPSIADCNKLFQRKGRALTYRQPIDQFAQAAIVEPQRIRLPSATCKLDSATRDGGALKLIAECADIISYTPRTVYVKLRSNDELVYSPTGDPVLATNLRKCSL